jgi:outer membrane scaffolding protein for murein synthesis (MipA/OmpV family)
LPYLRFKRALLATLAASAATASQSAFAQQQGSGGSPLGIGLGVAAFKRPYTGTDAKAIPFPMITYENEWVRIAGVGADLKFFDEGSLEFGLRAKFALADGYKSGDAPILNGMADRKGSVWIGPEVRWNTDGTKVSFELLGDALRKSKGIQAKVGVEHDLRSGSFVFTPHAAATFVDKKYVDYYYGVSTAEANLNRPAYGGRSTINLDAGLRTAFMFNPSNSIFVDLDATALGKGITDSPLVDHKVVPAAVVGYLYRF